jgi:hypothetical protein
VAFTSALVAIQKLPAHRQSTQSMRQQKAHVIESLNRLVVTLKLNKGMRIEEFKNFFIVYFSISSSYFNTITNR